MNWLWLVPLAWLVFDLILLAPDPPQPTPGEPTPFVAQVDPARVETVAILAP